MKGTEKWWLADYFPFWEGLFSRAMLVLGRVNKNNRKSTNKSKSTTISMKVSS